MCVDTCVVNVTLILPVSENKEYYNIVEVLTMVKTSSHIFYTSVNFLFVVEEDAEKDHVC